MNCRFIIRLCLLLILTFAIPSSGLDAQPVRVCVIEFASFDDSPEQAWLGPFIADSLEYNLKLLPGLDLIHERIPANHTIRSHDALCSDLCAIAKKGNAEYVVGGDFQASGQDVSVNVCFLSVADQQQQGGASFVASVSELCSRLDDLSVSIARALGFAYSDERYERMHRIPTASLEAMALYGMALAAPSGSQQEEEFLSRALAEDPSYADALSKLALHYYQTDRLAKAQEALERLVEIQEDYPYALFNLGLVYRARKHYSKAVEKYSRAVKYDPEDFDSWNNLGVIYFMMGMNEKARDSFRKALEINPHDLNARKNLARVTRDAHPTRGSAELSGLKEHVEAGAALYANGDYWRAAEEFRKALELDPDSFKANNNLALTYLKLGETDKAREHFRRALAADPAAIDVRENLAKLHDTGNQGDTANDDSAQPDALVAAGNIYLSRRSYKEAVDSFARAVALVPNHVNALSGLGTAYFALGEYDTARQQFEKALSIDPENEIVRRKLSDVEFVIASSERPADRDVFRLALPQQVEARARFVRANELYEQGKYEEAVSEYLRALDLSPASVEVLNNLGSTYSALKQYDEAKAALKKARMLDPDNETINHNLDVLASIERAEQPADMKRITSIAQDPETEQETDEAQESENDPPVPAPSDVKTPAQQEPPTDTASSAPPDAHPSPEKDTEQRPRLPLESSPAPPEDHFALGVIKEKEGNLKEALIHYREAVRVNPSNAIAQYNLGNVYYRLGNYHSAIECYNAALNADPSLAMAMNNIGVSYYRLGKLTEATDAWKRALEIDPSLESAVENLKNYVKE
ncbi:MAG: hypothetical protein Kow0099_12930 [Candidatus Abyssubacteria bacterium]